MPNVPVGETELDVAVLDLDEELDFVDEVETLEVLLLLDFVLDDEALVLELDLVLEVEALVLVLDLLVLVTFVLELDFVLEVEAFVLVVDLLVLVTFVLELDLVLEVEALVLVPDLVLEEALEVVETGLDVDVETLVLELEAWQLSVTTLQAVFEPRGYKSK